MPELRPFRGLRYDESRAGALATLLAPPYDVISPADRAALVARGPYNVVELELPEAPAGADPYESAADRLAEWRRAGILVADARPGLYLYEQEFPQGTEHARRRGLVGAVGLTDWSAGAVLPHERTFSGPKEDRRRLLRATRTNISPVFGLYEDATGELTRALDRVAAGPPAAEATVDDGQTHRLWPITDPALIALAERTLAGTPVVIADGHHRYETALEYFHERQRTGTATTGDGLVMMVLVALNDPGLAVVPTHRLVHGVPTGALSAQIDRLRDTFAVQSLTIGSADECLARLTAAGRTQQAILLATAEADFLLTRPIPANPSEPLDLVDTAVLESAVIRPVLEPLHGESFPEYVSYVRDPAAALAAARADGSALAGLVNPTPPEIVLRVARAGRRMPQKTTYFYPKLSTGIVLRPLDETETA